MKLKVLCTAVLLAAGSIGVACASTNLISNGQFTQVSSSKPGNSQDSAQFGTQQAYGYTSTQFINDWTGNDGYALWFYDANTAVQDNAYSVWGQGSNHDTGLEKLWAVTAPPAGGSFVGLDGDQQPDGNGYAVQASIGQNVDLVQGQKYTVSFDWGAAQLQSRTGDTNSSIQISLGGTVIGDTGFQSNTSHEFSGWTSYSFSFIAGSSGSQFLNFLAIGTPSGFPPVSLLANVSVSAVPEPPELALFGGGLLGLGLLTVAARRRALRVRDAGAA